MPKNLEMQGIEFKIVDDAKAAKSGLDGLKSTLDRLKTATSGATNGLDSASKRLNQFNNSLSEIARGGGADKMERLTRSLQRLQAVSADRSIGNLANRINKMNAAIASIKWTDSDKLTQIANSLRPLSELAPARLTSYINQLGKLVPVINALSATDLEKFSRNMERMAVAMRPFAEELSKVSAGFSALPRRIQRLIVDSDRYSSSANRAAQRTKQWGSAMKLLNFGALAYGMKRLIGVLAPAIVNANEFQENMNLFEVSMGEYAESAYEYGQEVRKVLGIDISEWARNQGIFNVLLTGFGDSADRAAVMSQNLTQLGYDLSSLFNADIATSMKKLQSGIAGELEPLRQWGFDLSQARLQLEATTRGISKNIAEMTQAEKAELRYQAILTQVTEAQQDFARTLESPANQIRVLKAQLNELSREIGNIFEPMLKRILPIAIAVVDTIKEIAHEIALMFGFEEKKPKNPLEDTEKNAEDTSDALEEAADNAKDLKKFLLGIDELNIIPSSLKDAQDEAGGGFGFELEQYDFLEQAKKNAEQYKEQFAPLKDMILNGIRAIKAAIDGIKKTVSDIVDWVKRNLGGIFDDLFGTTLEEKLRNLLNLVLTIGAAFAAWKVAQGIMSIINGISSALSKLARFGGAGFAGLGFLALLADMKEFSRYLDDFLKNGPNFKNVVGMISEFVGMVGDILIMSGNLKAGGLLKIVQGIGEVVIAVKDIADNGVNLENATTAVRGVSNLLIGFGAMTGNIKLAAIGVTLQGINGIVRELPKIIQAFKTGDWSGVDKVAVAISFLEILGGLVTALDIFGRLKAIAGLGKASQAMNAVGTATQAVSTAVGATLAPSLVGLVKNIGMGILLIAEVAAIAIIFAGAIAIMGKELGVVAEAWDPVLNAGDTVARAILIGTALMISVGAAAAALGAATIGSSGTIILAIGAGTAMLVGLAASFVIFTESVVAVAEEMNGRLVPALSEFNDNAPALNTNMVTFIDFLKGLAAKIGGYTTAMGNVTWSTIVGSFKKMIDGNPIAKLATDVSNVAKDTSDLNYALEKANPELEKAIKLMGEYNSLNGQLGSIAQGGYVGGVSKKLANINVQNVQYKADGGLVGAGQLFIAREAGPEIVGQMGGHTAVANNDQIVEGISAGVSVANGELINAIYAIGNMIVNSVESKDMNTYMDGRLVSRQLYGYNQQTAKEHGSSLVRRGATV